MSAPVRWGFLGAGRIAATALAPAVHAADGAVLSAVAARDPGRAAALEPATVYGSYPELLADADVEAVYVALANDAHRPWSEAALRAGKHVLCEKPLTLSAADVDAMATTAAATGRLLVEASWYRWHPRIRLAQRMLADGAVGPVRQVRAAFAFDGVPPGNYRLDPAKGGGGLYDVGCYAVSAALWAFGGTAPEEVDARMGWGPTGVDEWADLTLRFPGGGTAEVHAGIAEPVRQQLHVAGERGELELPEAPYTAWREEATRLRVTTAAGTEEVAVPAADAYRLMVEDVSRRIRGGEGYLLSLAESRATAAVLDAAFASARSGGVAVAVQAAATG